MNTASRDETITHTLSFFQQSMDNEVIALADYKRRSGAELDGYEAAQLWKHQYYNIRIFENIYIQYQRGQFSDEEWMKYREILKGIFRSNDIALDMWNKTPHHWSDDFKLEVAKLLPNS